MRKILIFSLLIFSLLFALAERPKDGVSDKEQTRVELFNKMKNAYQRAMAVNFSKAFFDYEKNYNRYFEQFSDQDETAELIRLNYLRLRYKYGFQLPEYLDSFEKDFPNSNKGQDDRKFFRGVVLFNNGNFAESEEYLKSVVIGAPYYWNAQKMLMEVYEKTNRVKEALQTGEYLLTSGFEKGSKNYELYKYRVALLYLDTDQINTAKKYLEELKDSKQLPQPILEDIRRKLSKLN